MNQEPVNVSPRADLEDCKGVMAERRIRHLPVAEQGHVLGGDLLHRSAQACDPAEGLCDRAAGAIFCPGP